MNILIYDQTTNTPIVKYSIIEFKTLIETIIKTKWIDEQTSIDIYNMKQKEKGNNLRARLI